MHTTRSPRALALALGLLPILGACSGGNSAPTPAPDLSVDAGEDLGSKTGRTVTLQAQVSNGIGDLSYSWTQLTGTSVTLSDPSAAAPTFTAPYAVRDTPSLLSFRVTVADADGRSSSDEVEVSVGHAERAVFLSEAQGVGVAELVLFDLALGTSRIISGDADRFWDVISWAWSPDETALVFTRTRDGSAYESYVVAPDGTGRTLMASSTSAPSPSWLPDGSAVVFLSDVEGTGPRELFSCPPDGSSTTRLHPEPVAGGEVAEFVIPPDGSRVVFRGDLDTDGQMELYSAAPDGSNPMKISRAQVAGGNVSTWTFSDDGGRVAYLADAETDGTNELYAVDPDGSNPVKLSGALVVGGSVLSFAWAPGGDRLCYLADQDTDGRNELYAVDADGSDAVKLSGPNPGGGNVVGDYVWSPTGAHVAFRGDLATASTTELFAVAADGSSLSLLNDTMVVDGDIFAFEWSPDGSRIAYAGDQDTDGMTELFCVAPDHSERVRISPPLVAGGDVVSAGIAWAPDGSRVLFRASAFADLALHAFSATPDGDIDRLTPSVLIGNVEEFGWAPDSSGVLIRGNLRTYSQELFHCAADGAGFKVVSPVTGTVLPEVQEFRWAPDSSTAAYLSTQRSYFAADLFTIDLATGKATPHTTNFYGSAARGIRWAPDGSDTP